MEFVYLVLFLLSIDERSLRPLHRLLPSFAGILQDPERELARHDIELPPWNRHVLSYAIPGLLVLAVLIVAVIGQSVLVALAATVAWVAAALALRRAGRGDICRITPGGVEFHCRRWSAFCPWNLFYTDGVPVYGRGWLYLPVEPSAVPTIELRKEGAVIAYGTEANAAHFRVLPEGEVCIKHLCRAQPLDLGMLLLSLGRGLGSPPQAVDDGADTEAPRSVPRKATSDGWVRLRLTRLQLPGLCCDCCCPTSSFQEFRGDPSQFADSVLATCFILIAPVCAECRRANRRHYWRALIKTFVLVVVGLPLLCLPLGALLDVCGLTMGPGAMTAILTMSGIVVALVVAPFVAIKRAGTASAPLQLADYRPGEGTIQLRFRNARYREIVLAQMWNRDAAPV